jgi:hypothetical protein
MSVVNNMGLYHTSQIQGLNTRRNFDLYRPQTNLTTYQREPYYFGIKLFNHLPLNFVMGSQYTNCHCYPTAGYIGAAASVTEFPEICAIATQWKVVTNSISIATISYS